MPHSQINPLILAASTGSLGSINGDGSPFVSLVTVADRGEARMTMLLSGLAVHTKNISRENRVSLLLVSGGEKKGEPLSGARVTLVGDVQKLARGEDGRARSAFLSRHPSARIYADFEDFAFYDFMIRSAHLVAGFGRTETIDRSDLL